MKKIAVLLILFVTFIAVPCWAQCPASGRGDMSKSTKRKDIKKKRDKAEQLKDRSEQDNEQDMDDGDFDDAFDDAEQFSSSDRDSDTGGGGDELEETFRQEGAEAVEERLEDVQGGDGTFSDSDILVRTDYHEESRVDASSSRERVSSDVEVRRLSPDSGYTVKPTGDSLTASGGGDTRAEALNSALGEAADQAKIRISGEMSDRQSSSGGGSVESRIDASSKTAFSDYRVTNISQSQDGRFEVTVDATPGSVIRR